jgi:hypothetical protein
LVSPFRSKARLEAEIATLRQQLEAQELATICRVGYSTKAQEISYTSDGVSASTKPK